MSTCVLQNGSVDIAGHEQNNVMIANEINLHFR